MVEMHGRSGEWSDLIGLCYVQYLAQALVVCVTRLLSIRFESLGLRLNLNPDWAPTLKLGHQILSDTPDPAVQSRYDRARERDEKEENKRRNGSFSRNGAPAENDSSSEVRVHAPAETGTSCQTD